MKFPALKTKCALALVVAGIFAAGPVMADKPEWAGKGGKGGKGKHERMDRRDDDKHVRSDDSRKRGHFEERHTVVVREYYTEQFSGGGRCPPGLAKKRNGCMPPGQAKKWQVGRPLPREVIYYEVPQPLVVQIGPPPSGHRYVRVASDILMIAIGSGMVVDAIQNLGRS